MINCPACSGFMRALETRAAGKGPTACVRRRRQCDGCKQRVTTKEIITDERMAVVPAQSLRQLVQLVKAAFPADSPAISLVDQLHGVLDESAGQFTT